VRTGASAARSRTALPTSISPLGFDRPFAAEWLCQEPPRSEDAPHDWSMVTRQDELERWESASGISIEPRPFFRRELLADRHVWRFSHATRATPWSAGRPPTAVGP
jgi:hypothetical protein